MEPNLIDIPNEFYPYDSHEPFKECLVCNIDLTLGVTDYFVEKAIKNNLEFKVKDVVFEYAMCSKCAQNMQQSISIESQQSMQNYFASQAGFMSKIQAYQAGKGDSINELLSKCTITGKSIDEMPEYMIFGHFKGDKMIASTMPYVVGNFVMDALSELLSTETLDEMNGFKDQYFGGPVELEDLWKNKPVFL